jgi:plasmid stability protein
MANLSVRKLDDEVVSKLRLRAVEHGVSMEEEVRRIIMQAVSSPVRLGDMALDIFGADFGVDLTLDKQTPHEPIDL